VKDQKLHLAKLEINGFKSFPGKTELHFEEGMMGVVGPNGCGKTNILDSIRWVLGEQRPSLLRSTKSEEIIFNGTADLPPNDMAEVSLNIKNTRGILPIEYDEVVITRRLFRSGDSEYLINKKLCRLKDIVELFADTGMGTHAYSVFQTGMIDTILSENADERRFLFEEASGITKYKSRKKEALKKLENTEADMLRLGDIIAEISKNVRSLQRQAARARRFKTIRDDLRDLEAVNASARAHELEISIKGHEKKLLELKMQRESQVASLDKSEALDQNLKLEIASFDENIAEETARTSALDARIIRLENNIANAQNALNNGRENVKHWSAEIGALEQRGNIFAEQKQQALDQLGQSRSDLSNLELIVGESENKVLSIKSEMDNSQKQLESLRENLHRSENELVARQTRLEAARNSLEQLNNRGQKLDSTLEAYKGRKEFSEQNFTAQKQKVEQCQNLIAEFDGQIAAKQQALIALTAQLDDLKRAISGATADLSAVKARHELLSQMIAQHEGYGSGVKAVFAWDLRPAGVIDTLANLISSAEQYHQAIEAALNKYGQLIVCRNRADALACIAYLKSNNLGRASFLLLDQVISSPSTSIELESDGVICCAADAINCPDYLRAAITRLFGDMTIFQAGQIPSGYSGEAVDLEGNYHSRLSLVEGGHFGVTLIGRKDELTGLEIKANELQARLAELSSELNQKETELASLNQQGIDLSEKKRKTLTERENLLSDLARIEFEFKDSQNKLAQLSQDSQESSRLKEDYNKQIEELEKAIDFEKAGRDNHRREFEQASDNHKTLLERYEQQVGDLNKRRLQLVEIAGLIRKLEDDDKRLDELIQESKNMIAQKTLMIDSEQVKWRQYEMDWEHHKAELAELFIAKESINAGKNEFFARRNELALRLSDHEQALKKMRSGVNEIGESIHQEELQLSERRGQMNNILDGVFNETGIHITPAKPDDYDEARTIDDIQRLKRIVDKLGPVNMLADDEYQTEKDRLEFLESQMKDLIEAKTSLRDAITRINHTAEEKFNTTFEVIKSNFQKVFQALFEGGTAEIGLADTTNVLESPIEITARPSKKKIATLNQLSGGERALTAISLLFAIYMVKPSPFCILDEIDAPLDDANVSRFLKLIKQFTDTTQFIVITHNKKTMEAAGILYGITMERPGVSSIVSVKFNGDLESTSRC
jgi:chromosome segregation protein